MEEGAKKARTAEEKKWYLRELMGEECQCGKVKKAQMSFCYTCYRSLPKDMQSDLYKPIGAGYEEAYDSASEYLT